MRIKIKHKDGESFGKLVGLTYSEGGKCLAVVRLNGMGMILSLYHPTAVIPLDSPPPQQKVLSFVGAETEKKDIPPAPEEKEEEESK